MPGVRDGIAAWRAPIVGVAAIKGPAGKLMKELGVAPGQAAVADHYRGLICRLVVDHVDAAEAETPDLPTLVTASVMKPDADRIALAEATLAFAARLG